MVVCFLGLGWFGVFWVLGLFFFVLGGGAGNKKMQIQFTKCDNVDWDLDVTIFFFIAPVI